MTTTDEQTSRPARDRAAALFAAAARHDRASTGMQLRCLAACSALQSPTGPVPPVPSEPGPDELVTQALRLLGELAPEDFAHPDVLAAARYGRRALMATT